MSTDGNYQKGGNTPNVAMNRRTMLKLTGATAGAAVVGSGSVAADELSSDLDEGFWTTTDTGYDPDNPYLSGVIGPAVWVLYEETGISDFFDSDPDGGDDVILHSQATSASEERTINETILDNHLTDMQTQANVEARSAIADAWEAGKNSSEAYNDALGAIRSYYEPHEANHIETMAKTMLDLGSVSDAGTNEDDFTQANWVVETVSYTGSGSNPRCRVTANYTENVDVTLHDGYVYTANTVPHFRFFTESTAEEYEVPFTDLISQYDTANDTVTVTDNDGIDWTASLKFGIPNVPDADLPGTRVLNYDEWLEIYERFQNQSDTVAGNYSETFVDDMYAELDAGNIDPSDVRGVEGTARYLSGTSDATQDSYRMALLQQLDMETADLTQIASMVTSYRGYGNNTFVAEDDGRQQLPMDHFGDVQSWEGQLFARHTPDGGFTVGEDYAADPYLMAGSYGEDLRAVGSKAHEQKFIFTNGNGGYSFTQSNYGEVFYTGDKSNGLAAFDPTDRSIIWEKTTDENPNRLEMSPDETTLYAKCDTGSGGILLALNPADGTENWRASWADKAKGLAVSSAGNVFTSEMVNNAVHAYDDTGTELWSATLTNTIRDVAIAPDDSELYVAEGTDVVALDPADGTELWRYTGAANAPSPLEVSPDGETLYICPSDLEALATADQTVQWSFTPDSGPRSVTKSPGGNYIYICHRDTTNEVSSLYQIDATDGSQVARDDANDMRYERLKMAYKDADVSGMTHGAVMYDAPSSEEFRVTNGIITVDSMSDSDGNAVETTDWSDPDYDTYDTTEYATYTEEVNEYLEQIGYWTEEDSTTSEGSGGGFLSGFDTTSGLAVAAAALGAILLGKGSNNQ